jgi:hypothetical protein
MTTPSPPLKKTEDKCPKCGSKVNYEGTLYIAAFDCGSKLCNDGELIQTEKCKLQSLISTQAARIKELEETASWAVDLIKMYDERLIQLGEPPHLVRSQMHLAGISKAEGVLSPTLLQPKGEKSE